MITIRAYAKLNLYLQITGSRVDGYHDLDMIMQSIDLHDTLRLSRTAFGETRGSAISLEFLRLAHTTSSLTRNEMQRGVSKSSNTMI